MYNIEAKRKMKIPMFSQERRVSSELFEDIYDHGKRFDGQYVYVKVFDTNTSSPARFGVVVPQSVCKRAVDRNRNKRRLTHALKEYADVIRDGHAMLLFAKKDLSDVSFAQIKSDITALLDTIASNTDGVVENSVTLH